MKRTVICDIEIYVNYLLIAFMDVATGNVLRFELSERCELDVERLQKIMAACRIVTFNGNMFDIPLIYLALNGTPVAGLKRAAQRIISERLQWWQVGRELGVYIPSSLDHIDLMEPNPAVRQGLKILHGRLHGIKMQDLPYPHDAVLTYEQMDAVADYCDNDLQGTLLLFRALEEPLKMREEFTAQYGLEDMRSKSDAQLGEAIIKKRVEQITGQRPKRPNVVPGKTFKYDVPDFIKFETDELNTVLQMVRDTVFKIKSDGRVDMPKSLAERYIPLGSSVYKMGIGGLHSTESNRAVHADNENDLVDADVASQYPSIILKLGLYPEALGPAFLTAYRQIYDERLAAKKAKDKVRDQGGKIALNGCYGKLGSKYSILYAPHLMIAVTLTGQLTLLMLAERAELAGISVVSGNTDGLLFRCPKHLRPTLDAICKQWEEETGFVLEFADYKSIYNLSVNTYYAIKSDGSVKRKGTVSNPWEAGDLRGQMMKNPNMTICSDAALAWITEGIDPAVTIRGSRDIRSFVTVVNVTGGAKWREEPIGKVVRYYWAENGDPILYTTPHPSTGNFKRVSNTEGCRPLMNLPDIFPQNIDYDRYIAEAWEILRTVGAVGPARSANDNNHDWLRRAFGLL